MANEIAILERDKASGTIAVVFLFPIAVPKQVNGANVVPTPSADLSATATLVLTTGEKAALDAGTSAFETYTHYVNPDVTAGAVATSLKAVWSVRNSAFQAGYAVRYGFIGTRLSAP